MTSKTNFLLTFSVDSLKCSGSPMAESDTLKAVSLEQTSDLDEFKTKLFLSTRTI